MKHMTDTQKRGKGLCNGHIPQNCSYGTYILVYLAEANAVHSICNSCAFLISV